MSDPLESKVRALFSPYQDEAEPRYHISKYELETELLSAIVALIQPQAMKGQQER